MEAHWRQMVMKQEAVHIQETKQDADDRWVKWHLCPSCEAEETGQTEAQVTEANFKKPMERKKLRVERFKMMMMTTTTTMMMMMNSGAEQLEFPVLSRGKKTRISI